VTLRDLEKTDAENSCLQAIQRANERRREHQLREAELMLGSEDEV